VKPETLQVLKEALATPAVLSQVYTDLAQPAMKKAGIALEAIVGLGATSLLPIRLLNEKCEAVFRRNMGRYAEAMQKVPEIEIRQVAAEIGIPILERFTYVSDQRIASMFATLLAAASRDVSSTDAHPSFIVVIDSLSPDEAKILKWLSSQVCIPCESIHSNTSGGGQATHHDRCICIPKDLGCSFHCKQGVYLNNLVGLGILRHPPFGSTLLGDEIYRPLEEMHRDAVKELKERYGSDKIRRERSYYQLTPYGQIFCKVSLPSGG
jgi:hypothetical protein